MMRARNLGSLVNHAPPDGGGGSAAPAAAAEVVLYFNLVQAAGDASGGNDSGSGSGKAPEPCLPAPESGQEAEGRAAAPDAVAGRLLIRRRVARSGRSSLAVCHIPSAAGAAEPAAVPAEQLPSADRQQPLSDAGGRWHACTPAALRELLAPFGIQTEAVDRCASASRLP